MEWLLRRWDDEAWLNKVNVAWVKDKQEREKRLAEIEKTTAKEKTPRWYVNGQGQTMIVLPDAGRPFTIGARPLEADRLGLGPPHPMRIRRTFAVSATAVTMERYERFSGRLQASSLYNRVANLPLSGISWYAAAAYCNWLSREEGIDPKQWCFQTVPEGAVGPNVKLVRLRPNYLHLRGYRLPTEAEMEYAIRAGAATPRFFGATEDLLPKYAWYYNNSQTYLCPAGTLKPNDFGIFDAHGNVLTWCQERYKPGPQEGGTMDLPDDDKEDSLEIDTTIERPVRGGSFNAPPRHIHCSFRTRVLPTNHSGNIGFRVARTLTAGDDHAPASTPPGVTPAAMP